MTSEASACCAATETVAGLAERAEKAREFLSRSTFPIDPRYQGWVLLASTLQARGRRTMPLIGRTGRSRAEGSSSRIQGARLQNRPW